MQEPGYESALKTLKPTDFQPAFVSLRDFLTKSKTFKDYEAIYDFIKHERETRGKTLCKGDTTFRSYCRVDYAFDSATKRKNAIQFLLFFFKEFGVYLEYTKNAEGIYQFNRRGKAEFIFQKKLQAPVYDLFYWRTMRDDVGVAKIQFDGPDWKDVELVYHFLSAGEGRERVRFKGTGWLNGESFYVDLEKVEENADSTLRQSHRRVFLTLHVPENANERDYLCGVFATINPHSKEPVCGRVLLKLNQQTKELDKSDYIDYDPQADQYSLRNIPDTIHYALSNDRIKGVNTPILTERAIPHAGEIEALKPFKGTYQLLYPHETLAIRQGLVHIRPNGDITLTYNNPHRPDRGFMTYCANVLMIRADRQVQDNYFRYSLLLERIPGSDDLCGVIAGIDDGKSIRSSRVYLINVLDQSPPKSFQGELTIDQVARLSKEAAHYFQDRYLKTTEAFWVSHLVNQSQPPGNGHLPTNTSQIIAPPYYVSGLYNAFFITKTTKEKSDRNGSTAPTRKKQAPRQAVQLIQLPLSIEGNTAVATYGSKPIKGTVLFDGEHTLTIQFDNPLGILMLSVPMPGEPMRKEPKYYSGVLIRMVDNKPEASAVVLHRESDATHRTYKAFREVSDLINVESRYPALVSFLFGDWARYIKMPGYAQSTADFPLKYAVYRRTFFAAACYYASRNEVDLCLDSLKRAFLHGFAVYQFGVHTPDNLSFPEDLLEERRWLQEAVQHGVFDNPLHERYVRFHWKLEEFPVKTHVA